MFDDTLRQAGTLRKIIRNANVWGESELVGTVEEGPSQATSEIFSCWTTAERHSQLAQANQASQ